MPKITPKIAGERIRKIEDAALKLFVTQGFNGVGLRTIAGAAGVSLGNIYNYFKNKEAIFESIIDRLHTDFSSPAQPLAEFLKTSRFPDDLEQFGLAVGKMVEAHKDYLTLIYVDIAEFGGKHVRSHYQDITKRFDVILHKRFRELRDSSEFPADVDPSIAFTLVYMQYFNYFIVERLIGAKGHLNLDDHDAIKTIASLFTKGLRV